ncbi:MAG TPA: response regulator [Polyangiaceae bacterium]|nr:response regulator [Polyangiaceae bacterium]
MNATVLLVEDERDTRELLSRALSRAGYECLPAATAREALSLASARAIDVVVSDVVLGTDERGGLALMNELRAVGVHAPVVIITAYADVEKVKIALNQGAAQLLEKPFRAPELIQAIERVQATGANVRHAIERVLSRANLTEKECAVARQLLEGLSSSEIAEAERNSPRTIRQHVSQIYAKCGVRSRAEFFRLVYFQWQGGPPGS